MPDLTIMLDVPVEVGWRARASAAATAAPTASKARTLEFHQKLRDAYLAIAAESRSAAS